ncbi:MAG: hypothetical protein AMS21_12670 [Gemmatimonas sp. SG8_38_2]|nr:MAG: hypothetical protein AMS21_12670 [Gemmatimonas sp. SG8_38_2]
MQGLAVLLNHFICHQRIEGEVVETAHERDELLQYFLCGWRLGIVGQRCGCPEFWRLGLFGRARHKAQSHKHRQSQTRDEQVQPTLP